MKKTLLISGAIAALGLSSVGVMAQTGGQPPVAQRAHGGPMALADANKDGNLTKAEYRAFVEQRFDRMDVNKDGKLTKEDRELRRKQRQDAWFEQVDTDRNGQISKAELAAHHEARQAKRDQHRAAAADAKAERGDRRGHRGFGKYRHGGFGMMHGAGKDGVVTKTQFVDGAMARFDAMDTNKDGVVTKAERDAARAQMKAKWQERRAAAKAPSATPAP